MSTIIIGSGTSVLDYEMGELIDGEFDEIVRFHGFDEAPKEYEENVGSRVTEMCMNTNIQTAKTVRRKLKGDRFEELGVEQFYVTWTRKRSLRRALQQVQSLMREYEICNHEFIKQSLGRYSYEHGLEEYEVEQDLSSGLMMVAHKVFDEGEEDLWIHGFDALEMDDIPPEHYYEDGKININRIHDLQNEARVLREMIRNEDVKKLSDHVT